MVVERKLFIVNVNFIIILYTAISRATRLDQIYLIFHKN
jgi:hypothetical protein